MKNQKGITLIALVITIIVLLILAGVSIAMLTGENGILKKATDSASASEVAAAKETAQLDVNAAMADYYDAKYVNPSSEASYENFAAYVTAKSITISDATQYSISGTTITLKVKDSDGTEITGTIGENGGITWSD